MSHGAKWTQLKWCIRCEPRYIFYICECVQTICGAASVRWGLHLIGYRGAVSLWAIFVVLIIILCTAFWRHAHKTCSFIVKYDRNCKRRAEELRGSYLNLVHSISHQDSVWRCFQEMRKEGRLNPPSCANDCSVSRYSCEKTGLGITVFDLSDASMELWRTSSKRVVRSWPA